MKKIFRSLMFLGTISSIAPLTIIPITNSVNDTLNTIENKINNSKNSKINNENQLNESKIETDFPITTIQKTGHDSKKNVLFFVGEGYAKGDEAKFINDVKFRANMLFTEEPYRSFGNEFNIYATMAEAKVSGDFSSNGKYNNYFGVYNKNGRSAGIEHEKKFLKFEDQLRGFLDEGGKILDSIILCNTDIYFGVSIGGISISSLSLINGNNSTVPHEAAHSFAGLADEYLLDYHGLQEAANRTQEIDPEKVRWKEFFDFRWIGMIKQKNQNGNNQYDNSFIPSLFCKMNDSRYDFCEVCKHVLFTIFNKNTKNKNELYIADPFISLEHNWKTDEYYYELGSSGQPIRTAKNKKIDFRTVIQNYRNSPKKLKLKLSFLNENNESKKTWEQTFEIKGNELKNIFILTEEINFDIEQNDKVFGQVIDLETGKELSHSNKSKETFYDVNIQYKLFENNNETNKNIDNATESVIKVKKGDNFEFTAPFLTGYQFVKSNNDLNKFENINENKTITLYYKKVLGSKEFTLKLLEKNGDVIETKKQRIYENEFFKPKSLDFIFETTDKTKKLILPDETVKYENADNKVLIYKYYHTAKPYIDAEDIKINLNSVFYPLEHAMGFSYNNIDISSLLKVESNNVDTTKPGHYQVTYSITHNENFIHDNQIIGGTTKKTIIVTVLNQDGSIPEGGVTPNPENTIEKEVQVEINRINSLNLELNKTEFTNDELNKVTQENILNNLNNWSETSGFNYSITSFSKMNNQIKFSIIVQKNSIQKVSKEFSFSYIIRNENNQSEDEITIEINRINNLNIKLKKQEYTNDEMNKINSNNLFNNLNNWIPSSNFVYEIINFSKTNNRINFAIKAQKNSNSKNSNNFDLSYKIINQENIDNNKLNNVNKQEIILFSSITIIAILIISLTSFIFLKKRNK